MAMLRVVRVLQRRVPNAPSATDTLYSAIPVLKTVKAAADIANVSILGNVASALLVCIETAKDARANKEDALELVAHIVRLVLPTINWIKDMEFPTSAVAEGLLHDLKDLIPVFTQVSVEMSKITRRNLLFRSFLSLADKEKIQQQRRFLDNKLQEFTYKSDMRIQSLVMDLKKIVSDIDSRQIVTRDIVREDYTIVKQEDVDLLEEDRAWHLKKGRVLRAQFQPDKKPLRVFAYKQGISTEEFLAEVHRYRFFFHANISQFRGASSPTSPSKFVVFDDHPYVVREVLRPGNPCKLSIRERVRLALQAVTYLLWHMWADRLIRCVVDHRSLLSVSLYARQ
ncbi:hypothetical protein PLICRDRAFT_58180 [Plicaturopsis crispa FD-325 SS-3]|uniref:RPW8 domain-containing protein n=1 Tax=Plicaturopsis crispa FD-325 SS-3 TaxID=944288 RepID=A0A0C9SKG8_PLICR|nr:hypothetical protein PLICRDRAFT_58180 [Plicaturopsis crispa FD-325 SS-3]